MALGIFARRLLGARQPQGEPGSLEPVSTGVDPCEPVSSGGNPCEPPPTGEQDPALVFGSLKSAKEHAIKVVEVIRATGCTDRAIYQGEIQGMHVDLCEDLTWVPRKWDAVGRELAKLPGVRRGEIKLGHHRLTVYEVAPLEEVVELTAVERKRA